ncbi:MAG: hypothetical protein AB7D00_00525 [Rhodospirillaceae bacterium]
MTAVKMVRVISKKDGFRRAGRAWTGTAELPVADLPKGGLAALQAEPLLIVQEFDQEEPKAKTEGGKPPAAK